MQECGRSRQGSMCNVFCLERGIEDLKRQMEDIDNEL